MCYVIKVLFVFVAIRNLYRSVSLSSRYNCDVFISCKVTVHLINMQLFCQLSFFCGCSIEGVQVKSFYQRESAVVSKSYSPPLHQVDEFCFVAKVQRVVRGLAGNDYSGKEECRLAFAEGVATLLDVHDVVVFVGLDYRVFAQCAVST